MIRRTFWSMQAVLHAGYVSGEDETTRRAHVKLIELKKSVLVARRPFFKLVFPGFE